MYNKKYVGIMAAVLGLGLMLALTMFWGCSDDGTNSTIVRGDLNDPEFMAIRPSLDDVIESAVEGTFDPLTNRWDFPLDSSTWRNKDDYWLGPLNPDDSVEYEYEGGWHVIYLAHLSASGSEVFYDSMAFFVNDAPWMMFTVEVSNVKYRGSYQLTENDGETVIEDVITTRVDLADVNTDVATGTGTMNIVSNSVYSQGQSDMDETFDFDIILGPMTFMRPTLNNWDSYETANGELDIMLTYTVETTTAGETETVNQDWTIQVTVDDNIGQVEVTRDNTLWTYNLNL